MFRKTSKSAKEPSARESFKTSLHQDEVSSIKVSTKTVSSSKLSSIFKKSQKSQDKQEEKPKERGNEKLKEKEKEQEIEAVPIAHSTIQIAEASGTKVTLLKADVKEFGTTEKPKNFLTVRKKKATVEFRYGRLVEREKVAAANVKPEGKSVFVVESAGRRNENREMCFSISMDGVKEIKEPKQFKVIPKKK